MSTFPKYETYKDSGVEWLGKIPNHWKSEKGKWLFHKMNRPVRKEDGVVTAFRDGQVTLRTNRRTDGFTNAIKEHGYQGIRKGDLVIHAMDAFAGAIGVSESDGRSTPVYAACVPRIENTVSPTFYAYLLRYMAHSGFIETLAKGIRERSTDFRFNDFGELGLPLPPKAEQDRIVDFLDTKTAEIDALIQKKERQIQLLDEQKAIRINQAVTRGLNPKVTLKPSGIEWIGDIPEGWFLRKAKYVVDVMIPERGKPQLNEDEDGHPWITTDQLGKPNIDQGKVRWWVAPQQQRITGSRSTPAGSVLASCVGNFGLSSVNHEPVIINQQIQAYLPTRIHPIYLHFVVGLSTAYFDSVAAKTTITYVNQEKFAGLPVPNPPEEEQRAIVEHCLTVLRESNATECRIESQIQSLKTLRSTLIAHAVTGKIKV